VAVETSGRALIGAAVPRVEDPRLLTGRGRFVDDIHLPGMLHAAFVRSHSAHGCLVSVDADAARAAPGVALVLTAADLQGVVGELQPHGPAALATPGYRALAHGKVRVTGEPIALVVAAARAQAEDACELVEVRVDDLPAVTTIADALDPDAPLLFDELATNVMFRRSDEYGDPSGAFARLEEHLAETGRVLVHPFDDPVVIEGHSSLSREILEEAPKTEVIVTGVGGGGLVSGIAVGAPGVRVVGVEPEGSAALREGLAAGHPVPVQPDSIADALNAPIAGEHCLAVCRERGVESVLVSDDDIRAGFRFLYERAKLAAEPGAAAGVGALLAGKVPDVEGKTVAVVVSGGNVAAKTAAAILSSNEG